MMTQLPAWVKPGAIAFDRSTFTCFTVCRVRQAKGNGPLYLMHKHEGDLGAGHRLEDCKLAELGDLLNCRRYIFEDLALALTLKGSEIVLTRSQSSAIVALPEEQIDFAASVQSFANFFSGVIVAEEVEA
ncbi:hypothetical protein [Pseudanabaena sp. FACHB-2040]|uniref:hypothetical protein n=1 Tax=Pseudanabaena sp. FACHB-2040 TaxID=2692859 RepID=UPI00168206D5|nr:hypothetical protein [Pseudanabaena sp. FACHB-2040]MBD2261405.1 hypothetical protein [Pseudanabaena sp. FACHB-2040]